MQERGGKSQVTVAEGKRCRRSRRRLLFFLLLAATLLLFYGTNVKDWKPQWWIQVRGQRPRVVPPYRNVSRTRSPGSKPTGTRSPETKPTGTRSPETKPTGTRSPGSTPMGTRSPETKPMGTRSPETKPTGTRSPGFPQAENMTSLMSNANVSVATQQTKNVSVATQQTTNVSVATQQTTNVSMATQQTTQDQTERPTPVPYKSPGPYLVEYPYEYHFVINEPERCEQENPFLVLMVPVAPHNRAHRDIIRSTWGAGRVVLGKAVSLLFVLGLQAGDGAAQLQDRLLQESSEHRDLIQSDFLDCYKNLTIKTMVMLEWLQAHCAGASYAMKIDSDMFLNVPNLVSMLANAPRTNYMTGLVARGAAVLRDPTSRWFLPVSLYAPAQYPRYALGLGYVLSLDLAEKLVAASRHVKAVYIEDVYLGLCMQHLGIPPTDPPSWGYFHVFPVSYSRCAYSRLIATTIHEYTDRVRDWKDFQRPGPYC